MLSKVDISIITGSFLLGVTKPFRINTRNFAIHKYSVPIDKNPILNYQQTTSYSGIKHPYFFDSEKYIFYGAESSHAFITKKLQALTLISKNK